MRSFNLEMAIFLPKFPKVLLKKVAKLGLFSRNVAKQVLYSFNHTLFFIFECNGLWTIGVTSLSNMSCVSRLWLCVLIRHCVFCFKIGKLVELANQLCVLRRLQISGCSVIWTFGLEAEEGKCGCELFAFQLGGKRTCPANGIGFKKPKL